jgi:hypothetical protein
VKTRAVGLQLVVYDRTCRGQIGLGLTNAWSAGLRLYRVFGRVHSGYGARSFVDALDWLATVESNQRIASVQLWSHGKWGNARIGDQLLDERALLRGSALAPRLESLRARLLPGALFWFRTCESFGALRGQRFARAFADFMGCRVGGHSYVIGAWQSGLHGLEPGAQPSWDPAEGLAGGSPEHPIRALPSSPGAPNTISCLEARIPERYFDHSM